MNTKIALIGNPNCGKTTLFNTLTGTYQKTGNWTGVTTEQKVGRCKFNRKIKIIDLPGLYSLNANSKDEQSVISCLKSNPPDVIINVVDGTNLERNLFLTCELLRLKIPVVIAINFLDQLEKNKITVSEEKFSKIFDVPIVSVSALKNKNVSKLIDVAKNHDKISNKIVIKGNEKSTKEIYKFIEENISKIIVKKQTSAEKFTQKADNILTHKIFSIPIFFCIITIVYFLSIKIGGVLGSGVNYCFDGFSNLINNWLMASKVPDFMVSLVCDAIIKGVGTVASFFPQILVLFILLTLIEQSGYASRIAFILDRIFRSFGLSGKSILPMVVSCGCTVTGLMSTRTIENTAERRMTVFLTPFMPCGAKTAVFGWFSSVFFNGNALIASSMYFLSILCVCVFGKVLKSLKCFKNMQGEFILEMPTYRVPAVKDVVCVLIEKLKEFIVKAGTIVFLISVGLWGLENFGVYGYTYGVVEDSFLFTIGNFIKTIFYPLGFSTWQASVSVLTGFLAKEAVVETICLLSSDATSLFSTTYSVYAFMAFVLLSPPCIASLATAKRELNSTKWFLAMILFQFLSAYTVALIINGIGFLVKAPIGLILSVIIGIIITIVYSKCLNKAKKTKCLGCKLCKIGESKCQIKAKRYTT